MQTPSVDCAAEGVVYVDYARLLLGAFEDGLRSSQASDDDAVWAARHVVKACAVTELD